MIGRQIHTLISQALQPDLWTVNDCSHHVPASDGRPQYETLFTPDRPVWRAAHRSAYRRAGERWGHRQWWTDAGLLDQLNPPPIDRHWDWNEMSIEYDGKSLKIEKAAIVTGDQAVRANDDFHQPIAIYPVAQCQRLCLWVLFTVAKIGPAATIATLFSGASERNYAVGGNGQVDRTEWRKTAGCKPDYLAWLRRGCKRV